MQLGGSTEFLVQRPVAGQVAGVMVEYEQGGAVLQRLGQGLQTDRLTRQPGAHGGVDLGRQHLAARLQQQLPELAQVVGVAVLPVAARRQPVGKGGVGLLLFPQPVGEGPIGGRPTEQLRPLVIAQGGKLPLLGILVQNVEPMVTVKDQPLLQCRSGQGQQTLHRGAEHAGQDQSIRLDDQGPEGGVIQGVDLGNSTNPDLCIRMLFQIAVGAGDHHRRGAVGNDRQGGGPCMAGDAQAAEEQTEPQQQGKQRCP